MVQPCNMHNETWREPILQVLHGDSRTEVENSRRLHKAAGSPDKDIKIYPHARHQLLQDQQEIVGTVTQDILQWLLARV